jgi:pimeloyl-ACP methyl ester carboxylesterase
MRFEKNIVIRGAANKDILLDIFYEEKAGSRPVVIYAHGFNGFKDWGNGDLMSTKFAQQGFTFIKFNFSHNGTTAAEPEAFADLEAFGQNNYSKELFDLAAVIDWCVDPKNKFGAYLNPTQLFLIGHSMGGGISILQAARDARIKKLVGWASIAECNTPWGSWPAEKIEQWKKDGVAYYINTRTAQHLPMNYQLYEDYQNNARAFDIKAALARLRIPILICHGVKDTSVPFEKALELQAAQPAAVLFTVDTDHAFGRKHPWIHENLPAPMEEVVNETIRFLKAD